MKIPETNKLFELFLVDHWNGSHASYEKDIDLSCVIVDYREADFPAAENKQIRIQNAGTTALITPRHFHSEEDFNHLGAEAIVLSHRALLKNECFTLNEANNMMKLDLDCGRIRAILINSDEYTHNIYLASKFAIENNAKLLMFPEIPKGFAYCLPEPEFLGVISHQPSSDSYGIGIINTKAVIRVFIGDALSISTRHYKYMEEMLTICSECKEKCKRIFGR